MAGYLPSLSRDPLSEMFISLAVFMILWLHVKVQSYEPFGSEQ